MSIEIKNGLNCPVEATIQLIGGKYKAVILWQLMNKTLRYHELHPSVEVILSYLLRYCVLWQRADDTQKKEDFQ